MNENEINSEEAGTLGEVESKGGMQASYADEFAAEREESGSAFDGEKEVSEQKTPTLTETEDGSQSEDGEKYEPQGKFDRVLYSVYRDEGLTAILKLTSYAAVIATVYAFFYRIVLLFSEKSYISLILLCVSMAVPFALVTLARRLINAARPYELLSFYKVPPKSRKGQSFPSRHVFSIFAIGTVLCYYSLTVGLILVALGALLAVCRVLLGYHFIRDTVAGAVIGAISGGLGILFLSLI